MKDQRGLPVPGDLVLLPGDRYSQLSTMERIVVFCAPWYELEGSIFVSKADLDWLVKDSQDCPEASGIELTETIQIVRIAGSRKRGNLIKGFHHV